MRVGRAMRAIERSTRTARRPRAIERVELLAPRLLDEVQLVAHARAPVAAPLPLLAGTPR